MPSRPNVLLGGRFRLELRLRFVGKSVIECQLCQSRINEFQGARTKSTDCFDREGQAIVAVSAHGRKRRPRVRCPWRRADGWERRCECGRVPCHRSASLKSDDSDAAETAGVIVGQMLYLEFGR